MFYSNSLNHYFYTYNGIMAIMKFLLIYRCMQE